MAAVRYGVRVRCLRTAPDGTPGTAFPTEIDEKKRPHRISGEAVCYLDIPRSKGKKQEGVGRKGGEKNLDRGDLPNLAHPVESRGRQGQAERVGIKFVSAADRLRGRLLQPEKHFLFRACSFCLMVLLYRRTTGLSSDKKL